MNTTTVRIVDLGRGPQIEGHRLTVMDVFYYLHRGYDFDFIHQAMPSLTREQFDAVVVYIQDHREELVEKDRKTEEFHKRGIEAQKEKWGESDENLSPQDRVARLKAIRVQKLAEKNGAHHSD